MAVQLFHMKDLIDIFSHLFKNNNEEINQATRESIVKIRSL
jgi:hypothetical protein